MQDFTEFQNRITRAHESLRAAEDAIADALRKCTYADMEFNAAIDDYAAAWTEATQHLSAGSLKDMGFEKNATRKRKVDESLLDDSGSDDSEGEE